MIQVAITNPDGSETRLEPEAVAPSASTPEPSVSTVSRAPSVVRLLARLNHLHATVERIYQGCSHWDSGLRESLDMATGGLSNAQGALESKPTDWTPPRRKRSRRSLDVGATITLTNEAAPYYAGVLTPPFTVTDSGNPKLIQVASANEQKVWLPRHHVRVAR